MPLRCVIVDDTAHFLEVASALLEREGISVVGVASASAEAIREVERLTPDVTLIDIDLGAESGLELAQRLADADGVTPGTTILISAHAEGDFRDLIEASPAIGFLTKSDLSARAIHAILNDYRET
jgi:CheY-like chemotaxis protein